MIYLVRHGETAPADGKKRCLGGRGGSDAKDPPLTDYGLHEAELLGSWFSGKVSAVYASPLRRTSQTAERIAEASGLPVHYADGLREVDTGLFDGLTFEEIRERYPAEYAERGEDLWGVPAPGGESFREAGIRFRETMEMILREHSHEDDGRGIVITAHAGVIRAFLHLILQEPDTSASPEGCQLCSGVISPAGRESEKSDGNAFLRRPQPYGAITILQCMTKRGLSPLLLLASGWKPDSFFGEEEILRAFEHFDTPEGVISHMRAVAAFLMKIGEEMGFPKEYDWERLRKAALVHDIARTRKHHPDAGADYLAGEGFDGISALVRYHQSIKPTDLLVLTEEDLLFYADKRVLGSRAVSVQERFDASLAKCGTPEAVVKNTMLREKTEIIESKIKLYLTSRQF